MTKELMRIGNKQDQAYTKKEIEEITLHHFSTGPKRTVSFGQGCEGEPLTAGKVLLEAVKNIRDKTSKGTINLNTNASLPKVISQLADNGLDSIRVSMNSVREKYYNKYFSPRNYEFKDVLRSIEIAKEKGLFVSVNYFYMPGFSDSPKEVEAFLKFLEKYKIDMIQWRNLNYDPRLYFIEMDVPEKESIGSCGIRSLMDQVTNIDSEIRHGYFNPPKEKWLKHRGYKALRD